MRPFVHLHLHSEYSLLDGACRVDKIPRFAKENGMTSVALTDHGVMYGAIAFYNACVREGVKPIIGCEVYVSDTTRFDREYTREGNTSHLILLCKNNEGYKNLIYLDSKAFEEGFYSKPRIDLELLEGHTDGLICLSACLSGRIPKYILQNDYPSAKDYAERLDKLFGRGNFYLELQDHFLPEDKEINPALIKISRETGIPLVCTNDAHYLRRGDAELQKVLMCLQTGSTLDDDPFALPNDEFYVKTGDEMEKLFSYVPEALDNTLKIADECSVSFEFGKTVLPKFDVPSGKTSPQYLRSLTKQGYLRRLSLGQIVFTDEHPKEEYESRAEYELSVIESMGYADYYLIVRDFVSYARTHGVPTGPGRGSGAGSLVAYLIGITEIDSIKYGLLFERFLNPERISMPDFDIDFADEKRDKVFEYVSEKYGKERVCHIATFGTLAPRAAIRDVGRVLGYSFAETSRIAELIPRRLSVDNGDGTTSTLVKIKFDDVMELPSLKRVYDSEPDAKRLIDIARALEDMPRHVSTHAAGVVISDRPVYEYVPLALTKGSLVTQYDMDTIASLGLLKFDFLGLRFLTVIENTVEAVKKKEPSFDLERIPTDDEDTYKMISKGETLGLFQIESVGMRKRLTQLRPERFGDIMAAIALYRPGPMGSIDTYIENKNGPDKVVYKIPLIKDVLEETFGVVVYQEQVMQIFRKVAGYSFAKADIIRKAMSKKQTGKIESEKETFVKNATERGVPENDAVELFNNMVGFSKYAFNKSHTASYAVVTYRTAYLKRHYPGEYMASLLDSCIGNDEAIAIYKDECARMGLRLLPPDINESGDRFKFDGECIRFPLLALKNVGRTFVVSVVKERENGPYRSFEDFLRRMTPSDLNKRQIESLIKAGCFDSTGVFRSQLLLCYEYLIDKTVENGRKNADGQLDFFSVDGGTEKNDEQGYEYPPVPELGVKEKLAFEKSVANLYFSGHLLDGYSENERDLAPASVKDVRESFDTETGDEIIEGTGEYSDRQKVVLCGIIRLVTVKLTKAKEKMAFVRIEDRYSSMEAIVFPKVYAKCAPYLTEDSAVALTGELQARSDEEVKLITSDAFPLVPDGEYERKTKNEPSSAPSSIQSPAVKTLYLRLPDLEGDKYRKALNLISIFDGQTPVVLYDSRKGSYVRLKGRGVAYSERVQSFFDEILGSENAVYK